MQSASSALITALGQPSVVWDGPQVLVDWDGDGASEASGQAVTSVADWFDRTDPAAWGACDRGYPWAWTPSGGTTTTDYPIVGGLAKHSLGSVNTARHSLLSATLADFNVMFGVSASVVAAGAVIRGGWMGRYSDASNFYYFEVRFNTDSTVTVRITKRSSGSDTALVSSTSTWTYSAGLMVGVRCYASGSTLAAKVWRYDAQDEPGEWDITTTDSTFTTGTCGLRSILDTSNSNTLPVAVSYQRLLATTATFDDLSPSVGAVSVQHGFDDGMPDEVSFVATVGQQPVSVEVGVGPVPLELDDAAGYWSPMQTRSPLHAYPRDVAALTLEHGAVTVNGVERVRLFTGQLEQIATSGPESADLTGISTTRHALRKLITLPAFGEDFTIAGITINFGLTATWPVSYALHQCGIYPGPPAMTGCRYWIPCHGGGRPFLPDANRLGSPPSVVSPDRGGLYGGILRAGSSTFAGFYRPREVRGPYVGGMHASMSAEAVKALFLLLRASDEGRYEPGSDLFSQASARGRVQFFLRGDSGDPFTAAGGISSFARGPNSEYMVAGWTYPSSGTGNPYVIVIVTPLRHVLVEVCDGSSWARLYSADTVVSDAFGRSASNGWGTADSGQAYTVVGTAGNYAVTTSPSGHATISPSATGSDRLATVVAGSGADWCGSIDVSAAALPASGTNQLGATVRYTDSSNHYLFLIEVASSGATTLRISKRVGGSLTVLTSVLTAITFVADTRYTIKWELVGSDLRAKVWATATQEPGAWALTTTDSALTTGTRVGGFGRNDTAVTTHVFSYDNLFVYDPTTGKVPADGDWHCVGGAWDVAGNKIWTYLDGTQKSSTPATALSTTNLPTADTATGAGTGMFFALPVAEFQLLAGTGADPDDTPDWLDTFDWTQGSTVYPSSLELAAVADPQPREAWELLAAYAQGEQAALRVDENDQYVYAGRGYFATTDAQTVAETLTTASDAGRPEITVDPTKVRNVARVTYTQTRVDEVRSVVLDMRTILPLPPGETTLVVALDTLAVKVLGNTLTNLTAAQVDGSDTTPPDWSYICVNTAVDGSGTYATATDVTAEITATTAGQVTVVFTNLTSITWYLTNDSADEGTDLAFLGVLGHAVFTNEASVSESYTASVTVRGERVLAVSLPQVQTEAAARSVARRLAGEYAYPVPVAGVELFGDPRRQPGDLVTFEDPITGASGQWRSATITHDIDGADYRQSVALVKEKRVGEWGDGVSRWGRCRWAGQDQPDIG